MALKGEAPKASRFGHNERRPARVLAFLAARARSIGAPHIGQWLIALMVSALGNRHSNIAASDIAETEADPASNRNMLHHV